MTQAPLQIVLIDDDCGPMDYFKETLKEYGFNVTHITSADDALSLLRDERALKEAALFLIDIMMPPGKTLSAKDTNFGLTTGLVLIAEARTTFPNTPIISISNRNPADVIAAAPKVIRHVPKFETTPTQLADLVTSVLSRGE